MNNTVILGKGIEYSLDCHETKLNNNIIVTGTSGAGKTRGIVEPAILAATGSYVISDPKGNLYHKYRSFLELKGYRVMRLDFTDPNKSANYNFFNYIHNTQDILKIAHMLIYQRKDARSKDPFWDESNQLLLQSLIAYLWEIARPNERTFGYIMDMLEMCQIDEDDYRDKTALDILMENLEKERPDSYAVKTYKKFRIASGKTLRSILITINSRLGLFDTPEIRRLMRKDTIDIPSIGREKTALFVCVSDTDRSLDGLANVFFTQAMNELCRYADKECEGCRLPIDTRFILDDFGTNVKIEEFPRMISSIRSRGLSATLMIQSEGQLRESFNNDYRTIISNCDTYVYMGGNDVETAKSIAERCDKPVQSILNMPVGTIWVFRRGQKPINGEVFELDPYYTLKMQEVKDALADRLR